MKTRTLHKTISMLVTVALVLNMGIAPVFAISPPADALGLAACHLKHDSECGYTQTITMGDCTHEHGDCGYAEGIAQQPCTHEHDDSCGYGETTTVISSCNHTCDVCQVLDSGKPAEKVCQCQSVDSKELVHDKDCPLYTAAQLSEAVQALITMVDALPNAVDITVENKEATKPAFEAAAMAYSELFDEDKAAFEATKQYTKLITLQDVLYDMTLMINEAEHDMRLGDLTLTNACNATCNHEVIGITDTNKIIVESGTHNLTLNDVSIDVSSIDDISCAFEIKSGATVNLTLVGSNTLQSGADAAGLQIPSGAAVIIDGNGSLEAIGYTNGAGIGGGNDGEGGNIKILGGNITATSRLGAGIGGGYGGNGGTITILGGNITATNTGAGTGAGIGGGEKGNGGNITISGGTVMATGGFGAGIGGGSGGNGGNIKIDSGNITAKGGNSGAGIGGGYSSEGGGDGGTIKIFGGTVMAIGDGGAGIGGSFYKNGGDITISGGNITTRGNEGAGIGGGKYGSGGTIRITGGAVTAESSSGAGVGGGGGLGGGAGGNITIEDNAVVFAKGNSHIGAGNGGTSGILNKNGGIIFEGTGGKLYGTSVTPSANFTIPNTHTLTIEGSKTLLINSGITVENNGTISNSGTITNNGTLKALGIQSDIGTLNGNGTVQMSLTADMMTLDKDSYVYTGSSIIPTVEVTPITLWGKTITFIKDIDYTVTYTDNINVGTSAKAIVTPNDGDTALVGTAVEKTFEITQSDITFTGGIKTYKGAVDQSSFIYGDTITVKVTPTVNGNKSRGFTEPQSNQIALFNKEDVQLTDPQNVTSGRELTFTIETNKKALAIGENHIKAKYVAGTNMAAHEESVTITLNKKQLTGGTIVAGQSKPYNADDTFSGVNVTFDAANGKEGTDDIIATVGGTVTDKNTGTGKTLTVTDATIGGANADFYQLPQNLTTIIGTVEIKPVTPNVEVTAKKKPSLFRGLGDHNDILDLTAKVTGEANGTEPTGTVTFKHGTTEIAKDVAIIDGVAAYEWKMPPAGTGIIIIAEFTPAVNTNYLTKTGISDAFDIDKIDQKTFKITDIPQKTYGDVAFTLEASGGSGTGTKVTYESSNTNVLTINEDQATIMGEGDVTITATKAGDDNYKEVTATHEITIEKANPTISWGDNIDQTVEYTGVEAIIIPPTVALKNNDIYRGEITYTYTEKASMSNLFGFFAEETATLPKNAGKYEVKAHTEEFKNYKAASSDTMTLTIEQITTELVINNMPGKTYDGTAVDDPTDITSNITKPLVTYTYYLADGITKTTPDNSGSLGFGNAPIHAGKYMVTGTITQNNNITDCTSEAVSFTIIQAPLTVTSTAENKEYDGGRDASVSFTFGNGEVVSGDTVTATATTSFVDKKVGNGKTVVISDFKLDEISEKCYRVTTPPTTATANITAKALTINDGTLVITKEYDTTTNFSAENTNNGALGIISVTGDVVSVKIDHYGNAQTADVGKKTIKLAISLDGEDKDNYTIIGPYSFNNASIQEKTLTVPIIEVAEATYTGEALAPVVTVKDDSTTLKSNTDYDVVYSENVDAGVETGKVTITFKGNYKGGANANFTINKAEGSSISTEVTGSYTGNGTKFTYTIESIPGAQYKMNNGDWQESNDFNDITPYSKHTFSARIKEDTNHNAGAEKAGNQVEFVKLSGVAAPEAFILTYESNNETDYTVTIPEVAGCEYSFDGTTYNSTRTKTANADDLVTGYMRKVATDTHNASSAVDANITLPKFQVKPVTATPNGGSFTQSVPVALVSETNGADIYYTTDGSDPETTSTKYVTDFILTDSTTIKAIAVKEGMQNSEVESFIFTKSSGASSSPSSPVITNPTLTEHGNVNLKPTENNKGNAVITVSDKKVEDAIKKAQEKANKNGAENNNIDMTLTIDTKDQLNSFTVNLLKETQDKLIAAKVISLTINGGAAITFDLEAIKQMKTTASADLKIKVTKTANSSLSKKGKAAIGNRPIYDFKVTGGGKNITTFGNGKISLTIPYTRQKVNGKGNSSKTGKLEKSGSLVGVNIGKTGKLTYLSSSSYHSASKTMRIRTNHLSVYGVAYQTSTPAFTDLANHWAKDDIEFVVARGLLKGTTDTTFGPNGSMTRGMFTTALGKLAEIDKKSYKPTIVSQNQPITRQEMAVMAAGFAKEMGYKLPGVHKEIVFTDSANIDTWAKSAVKEMQMTGILMGKNGGKFDPTGIATRAEGAAILHRFVELVGNSEAALGWVINHSGNWMYFENGKAVTGKKKIDGKDYEFDQYGITQR